LFCSGGSSDGPDGATYSVTAMRKSAPERTLLASVLSALVKRDREITLISDLFHDQALYVERELEKRMGIADRPVFGETPRERPRARRKADSSAPAVSGSVDQTAAGADTVAERPPAHTPRNTTAERDGADLTITWRWFKLLYLAAVAFAIVWNAGVMGFWQTALSPGTSLVDRLPALPFVAAGVFLVYVALTGLLNSTRLTANDDRLTVRHGPIPAPGGRTIRTSDIRQLFCTKRTRHSRNAHPVTTYRVRVTLKDGRTRTLLWALDDFDRALFIEEQIEKHLGIEDRHVRGSVRG